MTGFGEKTAEVASTDIETATTSKANTDGNDYEKRAQVTNNPNQTQESQDVAYHESESDEEDEEKLPLSKARCIALVATVTGASFLNVRALFIVH